MARWFLIPGTADALALALREEIRPRTGLEGQGRWIVMHKESGWQVVALYEASQAGFLANWIYRNLPTSHPIWSEADPSTVAACLTPIVERVFSIRDWSAYQIARQSEIADETTELLLMLTDGGVSDKPENEESPEMQEHIRKMREARIWPRCKTWIDK